MITLQFIPYSEIENLESGKRLKKLLKLVKEDKIVLMEGRLKKEEEAELIKITMEEINNKFKGIELAVVYPEDEETAGFGKKAKKMFYNLMLGERRGFTVIGPATIVKEIKKDPNKIQLLTQESKKKKRR
jgi:hypothetical protein